MIITKGPFDAINIIVNYKNKKKELHDTIISEEKKQTKGAIFIKIPEELFDEYLAMLLANKYKHHNFSNKTFTYYKWCVENVEDKVPLFKNSRIGVGAIILDKEENNCLLIKEQNYSIKRWKIPTGHVDEGESLNGALLRELKEELNIDKKSIKNLSDKFICPGGFNKIGKDGVNEHFLTFLIKVDRDIKCTMEKFEIADFKWFPVKDLISGDINKKYPDEKFSNFTPIWLKNYKNNKFSIYEEVDDPFSGGTKKMFIH